MTCKSCEFKTHDGIYNVCHYPSQHRGCVVAPTCYDKPYWCPKDKPPMAEPTRSFLFTLYHNSGNRVPEHLWPTQEAPMNQTPRGDR